MFGVCLGKRLPFVGCRACAIERVREPRCACVYIVYVNALVCTGHAGLDPPPGRATGGAGQKLVEAIPLYTELLRARGVRAMTRLHRAPIILATTPDSGLRMVEAV